MVVVVVVQKSAGVCMCGLMDGTEYNSVQCVLFLGETTICLFYFVTP